MTKDYVVFYPIIRFGFGRDRNVCVARVWEAAKLGCCEGKKCLQVCSILRVL